MSSNVIISLSVMKHLLSTMKGHETTPNSQTYLIIKN